MLIINMINTKIALNQDGTGAAEINFVDLDSKIAMTSTLGPNAVVELVSAFSEVMTDEQKKLVEEKFKTSKIIIPQADVKLDQNSIKQKG